MNDLIEQIKADRKAGTAGEWVVRHDEAWPFTICVDCIEGKKILTVGRYAYGSKDKCLTDVRAARSFSFDEREGIISAVASQEADMRRVARVPEMEALIIGQAAQIAELNASVHLLNAIIARVDEVSPRADNSCEEPGITLSEAIRREIKEADQ